MGFTEWSNVMWARPLFPGHHQLDRPDELGRFHEMAGFVD
jgi:hypothetical protein